MDRLSDTVRSEFGRFGVQSALGELLERWPAVVGPAIARNAWPARFGRDGTLHVSTSDSVWAFELAHRGPEIAERLGLPGIRFAPGPLPRAEEEAPPASVPEPSPDQAREAAAIAAAVEDENLRESIERAVSLSLASRSRGRPV